MIPQYWIDFINRNNLRTVEFEIPENDDLSGAGGCVVEIFSEINIEDEMNNYWPGLGVKHNGYIPVGGCSIGTGDPYFINIHDGDGGPLYVIYHDEVYDKNYDKNKAVAKVLNSYNDILKYVNNKRA